MGTNEIAINQSEGNDTILNINCSIPIVYQLTKLMLKLKTILKKANNRT